MPDPISRNYVNLINNINTQEGRYNTIMTRVITNWDGNHPFVINSVDSKSMNIYIKSIFSSYKDLLNIYCKKIHAGLESEFHLKDHTYNAYEFLQSHNNDLYVFYEPYRVEPLFDPAELLFDRSLLEECANN